MSFVLWLIATFLIALNIFVALVRKLSSDNRADEAILNQAKHENYIIYEFSDLPWLVRVRLHKLRNDAINSGFTELATFSRKISSINYAIAFKSNDGSSLLYLEFVTLGFLPLVFILLTNPSLFGSSIFGMAGWSVTSLYENNDRIITTPYSFLSDGNTDTQKFYNITIHRTPCVEIMREHEHERDSQYANNNSKLLKANDVHELIEFDLRIMKRLGENLEKMRDEAEASCPL